MIVNEVEAKIGLEVPRISQKTSNERLVEWSAQKWLRDERRCVAKDIINNGKELLEGRNIDWELVLRGIKSTQWGELRVGEDALANTGARFIGGFAAYVGWSMHDPGSVYLSGQYLAIIADDKLDVFRNIMAKSTIVYGEKTISNPELIEILDYSLQIGGQQKDWVTNSIKKFLSKGDISGCYKMISSRKDFVRQ